MPEELVRLAQPAPFPTSPSLQTPPAPRSFLDHTATSSLRFHAPCQAVTASSLLEHEDGESWPWPPPLPDETFHFPSEDVFLQNPHEPKQRPLRQRYRKTSRHHFFHTLHNEYCRKEHDTRTSFQNNDY